MLSLLQSTAQKQPGAIALVTPEINLTYSQYAALVIKAAAALESIGLKPGDRLALAAENRLEYIVLIMALWEIGAVAVPISPRFPPAQIHQICRWLGCAHWVGPYSSDWAAGSGVNPIFIEEMVSISRNDNPWQTPPSRPFSLEQPATILLTSGTTQWPKAVLHSVGNHYFSALGANENIPFIQGDRWLLSLPIYHVGGLAILVRAIVGGGAVVIADFNHTPADALTQFNISHLSVVPTQLFRLLQADSLQLSLGQLKAILIGGSDVPPALIQKALDADLPIHTTYGSTEMSSQITTTPPQVQPKKLFTAGRLLKYRELTLNYDGEIMVKGPTLFKGYLTPTGRLEEISGWFATGDIGTVDADGYLTIRGRKDNMFISGGENICPEEIEWHIKNIPGIINAVVTPVKNEEYGWRPVAFLQTEGADFDEAAIRFVLSQKLPRFKIPDYFWAWPPLETPEQLKFRRQDFIAPAQEKIQIASR
jgi:O-succinylbenzoic acid--CoA ligase